MHTPKTKEDGQIYAIFWNDLLAPLVFIYIVQVWENKLSSYISEIQNIFVFLNTSSIRGILKKKTDNICLHDNQWYSQCYIINIVQCKWIVKYNRWQRRICTLSVQLCILTSQVSTQLLNLTKLLTIMIILE